MSTPDTNNIGIKLQAVGENLNTWGAPNLNNDFSVVSNITSGFNPITINGDYNVAANETNYATNNPSEYATLKLVAGTVAGAFNFIWANRAKRTLVWNATAFAAQMKLTASTGFSLPAGAMAWIATDGATDVYNVSSNFISAALTIAGQLHGVVAATASTDAVNLAQMSAAIATASLPGTPGTVRNSVIDTTPGYLSGKVTLSLSGLTTTQVSGLSSLQLSTKNPGSNEKLEIILGQGYAGGYLDGGSQTLQFTPSQGTSYTVDCSSVAVTVNLSGMTSVQLNQSIEINKIGNFPMFLLGTVNGLPNLVVTTTSCERYKYSGSSWGWN